MEDSQDESEKPEGDALSGFIDVLRFLIDSAITSNAEITVLKRHLIEHDIILDMDAYELACRHEQENEAKKLAAKSAHASRFADRATQRLGLTPKSS